MSGGWCLLPDTRCDAAYVTPLVLQLVRLVDLLDEAVRRCAATIKERREERGESITPEVRALKGSEAYNSGLKYINLFVL